jgi:hypothetical protein
VHRQTCLRCRGADQTDDDAVTHRRRGPPILADIREQPGRNLVPLADAGRQMVHLDLDADLARELRTVAAAAIRRDDTLLQLQRSGDIGSPRSVGSTRAKSAGNSPASVATNDLRPPPGRRIRPGSRRSPSARSCRPRPIVLGAMPVMWATAAIPLYPAPFASAAANRRRSRSSRCSESSAKRRLMLSESIIHILWIAPVEIPRRNQIRLLADGPLVSRPRRAGVSPAIVNNRDPSSPDRTFRFFAP